MPLSSDRSGWPAHLRPGAVRFNRSSARYADTIAFYRDLVGLPVLEQFAESYGEDGTIIGLPDARTHLEIVREAEPAPSFDQLVLYLDDAAAVDVATRRLRDAGHVSDPSPHAYWAANGAVVYVDPDGRSVVFAPWVYGRDPDPTEHNDAGGAWELRVERYDGDRDELRPLFELAEDSSVQLDAYLHAGHVFVARDADVVVGHAQLVSLVDGEVELKNMAVVPDHRGRGIGRLLVDAAFADCRDAGMTRIVVATGAADTGNLRFYQRCGFRFRSVERDAFTPATGYSESLDVDGVPLRDRVWLDRELSEP